MEYRILLPFLFQLINDKSLKKLFLSLKIAFQGRYEQGLPESSRTTQKVYIAFMYQIINKVGFIKINISALYDLFEVLYSDWVFHVFHILLSPSAKIRICFLYFLS